MKKIGSVRLGLTFAGCFLGAGYVSGQELWQFFGVFGTKGISGLVMAIGLLFAVGVIMIMLNRKTGICEADKLLIRHDIKALRYAVMLLELLFLFGVCVIMSAGVGALLNQLIGLPVWIGSAVFAALVAAMSLAGLDGMVSAFSATVPVLVLASLGFGIAAVIQNGFNITTAEYSAENPLMGSWFVAAAAFACYNIFGSIAMIAPLGGFVKNKTTVFTGIGLGALALMLIAVSVLVSVCSAPQVTETELPMLALAQSKSELIGFGYGILLLLAMFGTALSSLVAFTNLICLKSEKIEKNKLLFTVVTSVVIFCGSLLGFGDLISVIYPIFGYCSSVFIVLMVIHFCKVRRKDESAYLS